VLALHIGESGLLVAELSAAGDKIEPLSVEEIGECKGFFSSHLVD